MVFFGAGGIIYLNRVLLPTRIKSLIIDNLQEATQKKVALEELRFSIFKGLVLRDLKIYDDKRVIVSLKEGSCAFLILPVFKKRIIIPVLKLKSPEIFLERRKDNTLNLQDLFPLRNKSTQKPKFNIFIYKIRATGGRINFQDDTLSSPFTKSIDNLNISLSLALPASAKFNLKAEIPANPVVHLNAKGEFRIPEQKLTARVSIQNLAPREFLAYYQNLGININGGYSDVLLELKLENNTVDVSVSSQNKNLVVSKDKISGILNSDIKSAIQYGLEDKTLKFSGEATLLDSKLSGLDFVDEVSGINGKFTFNNSGILSDRLLADVWGVPIEARINLSDFSNPLLNINISSRLNLASLQQILKDRFEFSFPGDIKGTSSLSLGIQGRIPSAQLLQINGYLDVSGATLNLKEINSPFEGINGRLEFAQNQIKWSGLNFKYLGEPYTTSGTLTNFQAPGVQLELSSKDLSLEASLALNKQLVKLAKLSGRYLNSEFSLTGDINAQNIPNLEAEVSGDLVIDLEDIKEPLKKFKSQLEQIKPKGKMQAKFNLSGNINDIKQCLLQAELSGSFISAYGLKADAFLLDYRQADGLADIPSIHLSLYDGTVDGSAKMNLKSDNLPYWLTLDIQGLKIEKLKLDTEAKGKDIAGTLLAQLKINGFSGDLSKLSGEGKVFITGGKLWQLNLFKGLGSLIFAEDFANIIFNEGTCSFSIQDKYIFTDSLKLKSNIANLAGSAKIGFDGSLGASLNVEVLDETAPISGTFKDVTTAIVGQAGRFGVIKVSGTLKEPKYRFQPAVADIIKGLKDVIFGK